MANVTTLAKGGTVGFSGNGYSPVVVHHEIDIADAVAAGLATTQYIVVANLPADTFFELEQVEVVDTVVLGGSARIDIGDSADDDEFVSNATTYTAGTNLTLLKNNGSSGNVYTAADSLRLKLTGDAIASATGKIRFVWLQADTSRLAPMTTQS